MLIRLMIKLKMTFRLTVLFLHVTSPSVYRSSIPTGCQCVGGKGSHPLDRCPPPSSPQFLAFEIEQTFPSASMAYLLASE